MSRHYSTRDFFRQMPNRLLAQYFQVRGLLPELDFLAMRETKTEPLLSAWLTLPDLDRKVMDAEFREISALSCEKGFRAILDEANWHFAGKPEDLVTFTEKLADLPSHEERALTSFLEHPEVWRGALLFCHADSLPYWRKRKGFPCVPASVHEEGRRALAEAIRNYFHNIEGRGKNCVVEAFRRGDLDYFFAYPEDYSNQSMEWVEGEFARRPHNPAFEVIFVYSEKDGTLDLNFRGAYKAVEILQTMFAVTILSLPDLPPDPGDDRIYDLSPMLERNFQFVYEAGSGIQSIAVKALRLSSKVVRGDRVTVEADAGARKEAIYDLLDELTKSLRVSTYSVTQVELVALMAVKVNEKPKSITVRITHPNSCSLKYDDIDLKLRQMLTDSGIEPREPAGLLELDEAEIAQA